MIKLPRSIYLAISICTSTPLIADPSTTTGVAKKKEASSSIQLFNGTDLTGWRPVGGNGQYKVEDNTIVGYGEKIKANTFLRTEKTYKDFELTFEFKFDSLKGNSGVMFRAQQKPSKNGNGKVYGYQCEGDNKKRAWTAGLFDEKRRGWLQPTKDKTPEAMEIAKKFTEQGNKIFKWDDWNTIKIRCKGNHIQTWLNGEKRVDFIDADKEHDTREGFIGLQVHSGGYFKARWKNIILKEL